MPQDFAIYVLKRKTKTATIENIFKRRILPVNFAGKKLMSNIWLPLN